jgi:hypothetical protein
MYDTHQEEITDSLKIILEILSFLPLKTKILLLADLNLSSLEIECKHT